MTIDGPGPRPDLRPVATIAGWSPSPIRAAARLALLFALVTTLPAFAAQEVYCPNPDLDCHKVLVVPIGWVPPHCPDPTQPCNPSERCLKDPRLTAWQLGDLLNQRVNPHFANWSYGTWQFTFEVLVNPDTPDGWWPMPYSFQQKHLGDLNSKCSLWDCPAGGGRAMVEEAIEGIAAQASMDGLIPSLTTYTRLLVVDNEDCRYGQTVTVAYNVPYQTSLIWLLTPQLFTATLVGMGVSDDALVPLVSHELGHQLQVVPADFYGGCTITETPLAPFSDECNGAWDVMALDEAGPNHPTAYNKLSFGWLPLDEQRVLTLPVPGAVFSASVRLDSIEEIDYQRYRLVRIPFTQPQPGAPFEGYHIECRRRVAGDDRVPEEGVLIQLVGEASKVDWSGTMPARVIHAGPPFGLHDAALQEGEAWGDVEHGLMVSFTGYLGTEPDAACEVSIQYSEVGERPDPAILTVEGVTPDLWMDSDRNGLDVYPPSQPVDADGVPSGPGDPFSPGQANVLRYRIRNLGTAPTPALAVRLTAHQPIHTVCGGIGPRILDEFRFLGPIPAGGVAIHSKAFEIPDDDAMIRVRAEILPVTGEATASNNHAEKVFTTGATSAVITAAGPTEVVISPTITNLCPDDLLVRAVPRVMKTLRIPMPDPVLDRWRVANPGLIRLPSGASTPLTMTIVPPDRSTPGSGVTIPLSITGDGGRAASGGLYGEAAPEIDAFTFPVPVVAPSTLTVNVAIGPHRVSSSILVSGNLAPASSGTRLALRFIPPSRGEILIPASTDGSGSYVLPFTPTEVGSWTVEALWQGDDTRSEARSPVRPFLTVPASGCVADRDCDDGNACTSATCDGRGTCVYAIVRDGETCDDGNLCTTGSTCLEGSCGQPVVCKDSTACTSDICDGLTGLCRFDPVPLGEVAGAGFDSPDLLRWGPTDGAFQWNAYRGVIPPTMLGSLRQPVWNEACLENGDERGDGILATTDVSIPPAGSAHYYVVTQRALCGEGPAGRTPAGDFRAPANPCPAP